MKMNGLKLHRIRIVPLFYTLFKRRAEMRYRLQASALLISWLVVFGAAAQEREYPKGYFRAPLNIKMELVANFGELRNNHWHMGLDIRTQQRENLPVVAAAEGYIARIKIEPGGFGRAIYINHPNGYTTLYAHLNAFMPTLESWVKEQQYLQQSWAVELTVPPNLFPVEQGQFFAYSGNTGGSAGPHVHFEIRDTKTDACLNPLLFDFPIPDAVPPTISRLALYDRKQSVYVQSPKFLSLKKTGTIYQTATPIVKVSTNKVSFALGATDRFTASANPNGIYSARIFLDGELQSGFILDDINYAQTRYLNAQTDYRFKYNGGSWLQHLSAMPGDFSPVYTTTDGVLQLGDGAVHAVKIEVRDAAQNVSTIQFNIQFDSTLYKAPVTIAAAPFTPGYINVLEEDDFELFTTERTLYDTAYGMYKKLAATNGIVHTFISAAIPAHDSVTVRIKANIPDSLKNKVVIQSIAGTRKVVQKGAWNKDWVWAKFRQFGSYQALIDVTPPVINAPPADVSRSTRIVFTPTDALSGIKSFRAELDGQWLRFTNNGGRTWIYTFDEKLPRGRHELRVEVEDVAGNKTIKTWMLNR